MACPNPKCDAVFDGSRGLSVHIAKSEACREWREDRMNGRTNGASVGEASAQPSDNRIHQIPWLRTQSALSPSPPHSPISMESPEDMENPTPRPSPSPPPSPPPLVNVDSDPQIEGRRVENEHPNAAHSYGKGSTVLDKIADDPFARQRHDNIYHPFISKEDFEFAAWFIRSGVSMAEIDKFLHLSAVQKMGMLSFRSARELHDKVALLPKPPSWKSRTIEVEGASTTTPIQFFYRDGLEVFRFLYGNPIYSKYMDNVPTQLWEEVPENVQILEGPMTSRLTWEIQNVVGKGETLGLVMLGSDSTALSKHSGDKSAHCVYLSCGNISKDIRTKESSKCWMKIAEIPKVKFLQKPHQTLLEQRLYHICMKIVTSALRECSRNPVYMTDASGTVRLVRTILLAHLADYPEQQIIACSSKGSSPASIALTRTFDYHLIQKLRTKEWTLNRIKAVEATRGLSVVDFENYMDKARDSRLNGVHDPFWIDWLFADPSIFLTPDALHQWHKFFLDHVLRWARDLIGDYELDGRYARLQQRVGYKHFHSGFSHFTQHTFRESRDLQRSFLAVLAGHEKVMPAMMRAFRGIMEFLYYAQFESHSKDSLDQMSAGLALFHANKAALSDAGLRNGTVRMGKFNIPKLELMQHVRRRIELLGATPPYSTEQIERCHIPMAKDAYKSTNKKMFEEQMCRYLDRHEKVNLFSIFLEEKRIRSESQIEIEDSTVDEQIAAGLDRGFLPQSVQDCFAYNEDAVPRNNTTAFLLTDRVTYGNLKISEASELYKLPGLRSALHRRFQACLVESSARGKYKLPFAFIDCWDRLRMQLRRLDYQGDKVLLEPKTIMAAPPSTSYPYGQCNFVLVKKGNVLNIPGIRDHIVAQLRLVFQTLRYSESGRLVAGDCFAYVEPLGPAPGSVKDGVHLTDSDSGLYRVTRMRQTDGSRLGLIIPLTDIWRPVDIVPFFGKEFIFAQGTETTTELSEAFIVNRYFDKNTFRHVF